MIITATPSPSVDWTISLDKFTFGAVNRAHEHHREPSGKGINVSVALTRHGYLTRAIVAGTGDAATYIAEALAGEDVPLTPTPGGPVRTNITLLAAGRPDTKINTDNSALSEAMITALEAEVAGACSPSITFLSAGSLPRHRPRRACPPRRRSAGRRCLHRRRQLWYRSAACGGRGA